MRRKQHSNLTASRTRHTLGKTTRDSDGSGGRSLNRIECCLFSRFMDVTMYCEFGLDSLWPLDSDAIF
jgi:hypothetical protein